MSGLDSKSGLDLLALITSNFPVVFEVKEWVNDLLEKLLN
jgi:hypothetical protein